MKDQLPAYAAGSLPPSERARVDAHLSTCADCRSDLASWHAIAASTPDSAAPEVGRMVRAVLARSAVEEPTGLAPNRQPRRRLRHLAALMVAEGRLIRLAVPIASALVMALGVAVVLFQHDLGGAAATGAGGLADLVLALIAPIVAAAGISGTYRSARDPAAELVAAAPTSDRLLLLVRLTLVFGYDLVLATGASAVLAAADASAAADLNTLVGAWLGPMTLLSALSLLVAVRFGPDVALGVAGGLWAVRVLSTSVLADDGWAARSILAVWSTNAPVLTASATIAAAAVLLSGRVGTSRDEPNSGRRATHLL
ncbi:zf-HC2 domain-containing protein [Cryptosporangium sp. NPDC048952]|uniref:zf-HC2 domain-containing protein n=1 Tax=Cryptosporangium sp. NPDC048952 TaxID=3363961 RepID=UPI003716F910